MTHPAQRAPSVSRRDRNLALVGAPRTGKTFILERLMYCRSVVIAIDPTDSIEGAPYTDNDAARLANTVGTRESMHGVFHCARFMGRPRQMAASIERLCEALSAHPYRSTLIVDELGALKDQGHKDCINMVVALARTGHQSRTSVLAASHGPQEMPPAFKRVLDETWLTGMGNAADYEYLRRYHDRDIGEALRQVARYRAARRPGPDLRNPSVGAGPQWDASHPHGEYPIVRSLHSGEARWRLREGEPDWLVGPTGSWCVTQQLGGGRLGRRHD